MFIRERFCRARLLSDAGGGFSCSGSTSEGFRTVEWWLGFTRCSWDVFVGMGLWFTRRPGRPAPLDPGFRRNDGSVVTVG